MTLREYTENLLRECGCDFDCYKGEYGEQHALEHMEEYAKEHELMFPIEDIAKELIAIGNEQTEPLRKGHKEYKMVFDMVDSIDGIEFDSFEAAKADMEDTYVNWMTYECHHWKIVDGIPLPTEEQIEDYDYMIENFCCWIVKWVDELGDYEDIDYGYTLPQEELEALGWMEWNKFAKLNGWQ